VIHDNLEPLIVVVYFITQYINELRNDSINENIIIAKNSEFNWAGGISNQFEI